MAALFCLMGIVLLGGCAESKPTSKKTGASSSVSSVEGMNYFENSVAPAFRTQCNSCHSGQLSSIFVYSSVRKHLLQGNGPLENSLMYYVRGLTEHGEGYPPQLNTFKRDFCNGNTEASPCSQIQTWWQFEFQSGAGGGSTKPFGRLDDIDVYGNIRGYALDPGNTSASVTVSLYLDGDRSNGTFLANVTANRAYGGLQFDGSHGFLFAVPDTYKDLNTHTVYAFIEGSTVYSLSGNGKSFRVAAIRAAAQTYWQNTVVPSGTLNQCTGCHGNQFRNYQDVLYQFLSDPLPPLATSASSTVMLRKINGSLPHPGGTCENGTLCNQVTQVWNLQFK